MPSFFKMLGCSIPLLFVSFILLCILNTMYDSARKATASDSWLSVQGRVTKSAVEEKKQRSILDENSGARGHGRHHGKRTVVHVYLHDFEYTFAVDGKQYSGNRISYATVIQDKSNVEADVKKYPTNAEVQVFYDPRNPNNSVLIPGTGFLTIPKFYLIAGVSAVLYIFLLYLLYKVFVASPTPDPAKIYDGRPKPNVMPAEQWCGMSQAPPHS